MFSKNRDRLLDGDIAAKFLGAILFQPKIKRLLSTDHFSVNGTLIEAWASMKSFKPKDGSDVAARRYGSSCTASMKGDATLSGPLFRLRSSMTIAPPDVGHHSPNWCQKRDTAVREPPSDWRLSPLNHTRKFGPSAP